MKDALIIFLLGNWAFVTCMIICLIGWIMDKIQKCIFVKFKKI
jgi:hypothetical protein